MIIFTKRGNPERFPFLSVLLAPGSTLRILMSSLASCAAMAWVHSESASLEVA